MHNKSRAKTYRNMKKVIKKQYIVKKNQFSVRNVGKVGVGAGVVGGGGVG